MRRRRPPCTSRSRQAGPFASVVTSRPVNHTNSFRVPKRGWRVRTRSVLYFFVTKAQSFKSRTRVAIVTTRQRLPVIAAFRYKDNTAHGNQNRDTHTTAVRIQTRCKQEASLPLTTAAARARRPVRAVCKLALCGSRAGAVHTRIKRWIHSTDGTREGAAAHAVRRERAMLERCHRAHYTSRERKVRVARGRMIPFATPLPLQGGGDVSAVVPVRHHESWRALMRPSITGRRRAPGWRGPAVEARKRLVVVVRVASAVREWLGREGWRWAVKHARGISA